jgi:hypothetical protein
MVPLPIKLEHRACDLPGPCVPAKRVINEAYKHSTHKKRENDTRAATHDAKAIPRLDSSRVKLERQECQAKGDRLEIDSELRARDKRRSGVGAERLPAGDSKGVPRVTAHRGFLGVVDLRKRRTEGDDARDLRRRRI